MAGFGLVASMMEHQFIKPVRESKLALLVGLVIATVAAAAWLCYRFPRTAAFAAATAYLMASAGVWSPVQLLAVVLAVLLLWRGFSPDSFRAYAIPPVRAWMVRWFRYAPRWAKLTVRHGLVAYDRAYQYALATGYKSSGARGEPVVDRAKLVKVRWTPSVDRLLVKLPAGLAPANVEAVSDAFAHATRSRACRIRPDRPGRVWIELLRRDPLNKTIPALPVSKSVDLSGVPVGKREDGGTWKLQLSGTHTLIAGSTGAGKGSVQSSLLRGLAPAIAEGWVQVWAFDGKRGMELGMAAPMCSRTFFGGAEDMAAGLAEVEKLADDRASRLSGQNREHTPTIAEPFVLVLVDEIATLTAFADSKTAKAVEEAVGLLTTKGRSVGFSVVASVQDPGKDVLKWRNLFPTRVALRLAEDVECDMVLGPGARNRGAYCDLIDPNTPGVGYVRDENRPDVHRVRAAYCTDADVRAMAEAYRPGSALVIPGQWERVDLVKPPITTGDTTGEEGQ